MNNKECIRFLRRLPNLLVVLGVDISIFIGSYLLSYYVRFDFAVPEQFLESFKESVAAVVIIKIAIFAWFKLYRGMWRFTGITDLFNVLKSTTISSALIVIYILAISRFEGFARSVFFIDWLISNLAISGFRLFIRIYYHTISLWKLEGHLPFFALRQMATRSCFAKRLLVIGAGNSGEKIFREIRDNAGLDYKVVGFIDDHPVKQGKYIHGKPVLGGIEDLPDVVERANIDELLIAISSASSKQMRRVVSYCKETGLPYKTIPGMGEIISGDVSVSSIREVAYRDLLGRDNVKLDSDVINAMICNSTVLVTGAGGSIGSELSRQICRFNPRRLILLERAESPLYSIELELKRLFPQLDILPVLADIQYPAQLEIIFNANMPQIVFHAAAYKHVPMMEAHPWKAVKNNIMGTQNMVEASHKFGVKRFVLVSTDKAVRPTNVMGATKRIAELMVLNQMREAGDTKFMAVRFGNVVGSAGSVLPLFKKQVEDGGPITVTHKDITRFFMTIPEAAQLILQAGAMGEGGEIYILDMGEPVKIDSLARDFIRLSGLEPDVDIEVEYIGLRPGEKLYEELITEGEGIVATGHRKIMVLKGRENDLVKLNGNIEALRGVSDDQKTDEIRAQLMAIVPEYKPANH